MAGRLQLINGKRNDEKAHMAAAIYFFWLCYVNFYPMYGY